ncbi:hypothetical protein O181_094513, partial [Austropuccinia psidii MF-1]|nr:hypothetical protein [Austropuccinia psidii MF-1]
MAPLNILNSILGPKSNGEHPIQSLGGPPFFLCGPGLVSAVQAIWSTLATIIFLGPPLSPSKLGPGGIQFPPNSADFGLWPACCGPWVVKIKNEPK